MDSYEVRAGLAGLAAAQCAAECGKPGGPLWGMGNCFECRDGVRTDG
jgi:hypothetical protein